MNEPTREELGRAAVVLAKEVERLKKENERLREENRILLEAVNRFAGLE